MSARVIVSVMALPLSLMTRMAHCAHRRIDEENHQERKRNGSHSRYDRSSMDRSLRHQRPNSDPSYAQPVAIRGRQPHVVERRHNSDEASPELSAEALSRGEQAEQTVEASSEITPEHIERHQRPHNHNYQFVRNYDHRGYMHYSLRGKQKTGYWWQLYENNHRPYRFESDYDVHHRRKPHATSHHDDGNNPKHEAEHFYQRHRLLVQSLLHGVQGSRIALRDRLKLDYL